MASAGRIPPPEIITEILYRLPAKSVGRFRCVSKGWLSLLTDPQFIKTHHKTLNQNHLILSSNNYLLYSHPFNHHEEEAVLLSTPTKFDLKSEYDDEFSFCGSCNGLVLVSAFKRYRSFTLLILNPTTKESLELPQDLRDESELNHVRFMLGFGYDSLTDDYKVVIIHCFNYSYPVKPDTMLVQVYSLRTNTWRVVANSPYEYSYEGSPGVFVNGSIHWVANKSHVIVAFSLANECFSQLPSPNDVDIKNDCKLLVLGGKLAIFMPRDRVIWLMNEYGVRESWAKIFIHGLDERAFIERISGVEIRVQPMIFDGDNGKILLAKYDQTLIYDTEERSFSNKVYDWKPERFPVTGTFVESLVSLKTIRNPQIQANEVHPLKRGYYTRMS